MIIELPIYDIRVRLSDHQEKGQKPTGTITSNIRGKGDSPKYHDTIEGIESLILAMACEGIDITTPAMIDAIEAVVTAADNNL